MYSVVDKETKDSEDFRDCWEKTTEFGKQAHYVVNVSFVRHHLPWKEEVRAKQELICFIGKSFTISWYVLTPNKDVRGPCWIYRNVEKLKCSGILINKKSIIMSLNFIVSQEVIIVCIPVNLELELRMKFHFSSYWSTFQFIWVFEINNFFHIV